jgi:hypothetical protein
MLRREFPDEGLRLRYVRMREDIQSWVLSVLAGRGLGGCLRGSWLRGDFHLMPDGTRSYSDVDLVVLSADADMRLCIAQECARDIGRRLPMKVSVHPADSLALVGLDDSFYLGIGEYIAKSRANEWGKGGLDYLRAKLVLMLLRRTCQETYEEIVKRLEDPDGRRAWETKLGCESAFSIECAARLVGHHGHALAQECIAECVRVPASPAWIDRVLCGVRHAPTIEPWLRDYLVDKVRNTG